LDPRWPAVKIPAGAERKHPCWWWGSFFTKGEQRSPATPKASGRDTGTGTGHWDWERDTGTGTGHRDWDGTRSRNYESRSVSRDLNHKVTKGTKKGKVAGFNLVLLVPLVVKNPVRPLGRDNTGTGTGHRGRDTGTPGSGRDTGTPGSRKSALTPPSPIGMGEGEKVGLGRDTGTGTGTGPSPSSCRRSE
jgi:hypothetical protein